MIIKQRSCQVCGREFMPGVFDSPDSNICYSCRRREEKESKSSVVGGIIIIVIVIVVIALLILA